VTAVRLAGLHSFSERHGVDDLAGLISDTEDTMRDVNSFLRSKSCQFTGAFYAFESSGAQIGQFLSVFIHDEFVAVEHVEKKDRHHIRIMAGASPGSASTITKLMSFRRQLLARWARAQVLTDRCDGFGMRPNAVGKKNLNVRYRTDRFDAPQLKMACTRAAPRDNGNDRDPK
jgi:hypothetical protein